MYAHKSIPFMAAWLVVVFVTCILLIRADHYTMAILTWMIFMLSIVVIYKIISIFDVIDDKGYARYNIHFPVKKNAAFNSWYLAYKYSASNMFWRNDLYICLGRLTISACWNRVDTNKDRQKGGIDMCWCTRNKCTSLYERKWLDKKSVIPFNVQTSNYEGRI